MPRPRAHRTIALTTELCRRTHVDGLGVIVLSFCKCSTRDCAQYCPKTVPSTVSQYSPSVFPVLPQCCPSAAPSTAPPALPPVLSPALHQHCAQDFHKNCLSSAPALSPRTAPVLPPALSQYCLSTVSAAFSTVHGFGIRVGRGIGSMCVV